MPSLHFLCPSCEWRIEAAAGEPAPPCEGCKATAAITAPPDAPIQACGACGHTELYIQKDFNRATGIALVVLGSIFVPWTYGLSLLAVTILDLALYYKLGDVTVCYQCQAVHRGYPKNPAHQPFDLATHDRHVYGAAPPGAEEKGGAH